MKHYISLISLFVFLLVTAQANAISGQVETLLDAATVTADGNGDWHCLPKRAAKISIYLKAVNSAGSSPTLDITVQHSNDETNAFTLDTFTQATTGTSLQLKHINETTTHPIRCFRTVSDIGGTSSPSYTATVSVFYELQN